MTSRISWMVFILMVLSGFIALANKQTTAYFLRSLAVDGDDEVTETST